MGSFKLEFIITDGTTNTPLGGVTIQITVPTTNTILDTQVTDQAGKVIFFIDQGSIKYTISKSGYLGKTGTLYKTTLPDSYKITLYQVPTTEQPPNPPAPEPPQLPPKPGEIIPRPGGEIHQQNIGTRCEIVSKSMFNQQFFANREIYSNRHGKWESRAQNAVDAAMADSVCYQAAPPTPADWQTGMEQKLTAGFDGLGKYLKDGLDNAANDLKKGLIDLEGGLAGKIQTEITARINSLLDLEARLKAWIADMILELLMKKLDEGVKDVAKR